MDFEKPWKGWNTVEWYKMVHTGSEKVEGIKREITCRRQKTGRSKGNFMFGHGKYLICTAEIIMRTG